MLMAFMINYLVARVSWQVKKSALYYYSVFMHTSMQMLRLVVY